MSLTSSNMRFTIKMKCNKQATVYDAPAADHHIQLNGIHEGRYARKENEGEKVSREMRAGNV